MTTRWAVGVDLGGTNLRVALVDSDGRIAASRSRPTHAHLGADSVIDAITELVEGLIHDEAPDRSNVIGVGVGSPGPLDLRGGTIIKSANLPGWTNVPIRERMRNRLRLPVALDNDANAAALGEWRFGCGQACKDFVLLTLGTGVGAGVVVDGRLLHGHFGNAAELGHMIVVPGGLPCPCGQKGCLEQYASASAVSRRATALLGEKTAIDAQVVAERAAAGDASCREVWDDACHYLALACINIQHAFNPAGIAFGGGMSLAGKFLLEGVQRHFQQNRWTLVEDSPKLTLAQLGQDAGLIGAAALAFLPGQIQ